MILDQSARLGKVRVLEALMKHCYINKSIKHYHKSIICTPDSKGSDLKCELTFPLIILWNTDLQERQAVVLRG